jgi:hypothetical protein
VRRRSIPRACARIGVDSAGVADPVTRASWTSLSRLHASRERRVTRPGERVGSTSRRGPPRAVPNAARGSHRSAPCSSTRDTHRSRRCCRPSSRGRELASAPRPPALRHSRPRLPAPALRRPRPRPPRAVLVQAARILPLLQGPSHGRHRGPPRPPRASRCAGAAVGAHPFLCPSLSVRLRSRAHERGVARVPALAVRRVAPARSPPLGRARRAVRRRHLRCRRNRPVEPRSGIRYDTAT